MRIFSEEGKGGEGDFSGFWTHFGGERFQFCEPPWRRGILLSVTDFGAESGAEDGVGGQRELLLCPTPASLGSKHLALPGIML